MSATVFADGQQLVVVRIDFYDLEKPVDRMLFDRGVVNVESFASLFIVVSEDEEANNGNVSFATWPPAAIARNDGLTLAAIVPKASAVVLDNYILFPTSSLKASLSGIGPRSPALRSEYRHLAREPPA